MSTSVTETDYLIIGSGAAGLAFADTLIAESDADIIIVDRHGKPGGHWNDAYSFVTLHQPSSFYGVNSLELGSGLKDTVGLNKGLYELASGPEVSGYFNRVMNHQLLASGRVRYFPLCDYLGDGRFVSLLSGAQTEVTVRKKTVDATLFSPAVPSTHRPQFEVGAGVALVPPNALPGLWHHAQQHGRPQRYVVIGAGKTAMDACLCLLQSGADADAIDWIMPRDSWLMNRLKAQNAPEFFNEAIGGHADLMEAAAKATSVEDLFLRLEACGALLRIDRERMPTMFHSATVSADEIHLLRRLRNVIRLGRVRALQANQVVLEHGRVDVAANTLFIDCTASAIVSPPAQAVFQGANIRVQWLRSPQPTFSAALTAYVEAHYDDEALKNELCEPVPFANTPAEYPHALMANLRNQARWGQDKALRAWIRASRLDGLGKLAASADRDDAEKQAIMGRLREFSAAAMTNLPRLMAEQPS